VDGRRCRLFIDWAQTVIITINVVTLGAEMMGIQPSPIVLDLNALRMAHGHDKQHTPPVIISDVIPKCSSRHYNPIIEDIFLN
jgi:hypothetical protein